MVNVLGCEKEKQKKEIFPGCIVKVKVCASGDFGTGYTASAPSPIMRLGDDCCVTHTLGPVLFTDDCGRM